MKDNTPHNEELDNKIFDCLVNLGLNSSHKGFYYLRKMLIECLSCHHIPLLKDICEHLSENESLCGKSIQQAVYNAISKAFDTIDFCERVFDVFKVRIVRENFHPKLLISLLCEHLSRD